jgi:organic radical activating enzyme
MDTKIKNIVSVISYKPVVLSFLTTYKCTAACRNCCFQCSPKNDVFLSLEEMKLYLDQCVHYFKDSLKVVVFTGGEPFLLETHLIQIVQYAKQCGLLSRVVTNGFWANTQETAYNTLKLLQNAGLNEINFSIGDDHLEWISAENIVNGSLAAAELGITCLINVESHDNSKFVVNNLLNNTQFAKFYNQHKIQIIKGVWVSLQDEQCFSHNKFSINKQEADNRCDSILNAIVINPYSEVLSCCGLISEYVPFFRLGNLKKKDILPLYQSQLNDLLKIWLFTDGPQKIIDFIYSKRGFEQHFYTHKCIACAEIFKDIKNIECIQSHIKEIMPSILFKYKLLNYEK